MEYLLYGIICYMFIVGIIRLVYITLITLTPKICRGCLIKVICEKVCNGYIESFKKKNKVARLLQRLEFNGRL